MNTFRILITVVILSTIESCFWGRPSIETATYFFEFRSTGKHDLNPLFKGKLSLLADSQEINMALTGNFKQIKLENIDSLQLMAFQYEPSYTCIVMNGDTLGQTETINLNLELQKTFYGKVTKSGKIIVLNQDSTLSPMGENFQKLIVANFQFVQSEGDNTSWKFAETETMGNFQSRYQKLPTSVGSSISILKTIEKFTTVNGSYGVLGTPELVSTDSAFFFIDPNTQLIQTIRSKGTRSLFINKTAAGKNDNTFSAKLIEQTYVPFSKVKEISSELKTGKYPFWKPLNNSLNRDKSKMIRLKKQLAGLCYDQIRLRLVSLHEWNDTLFEQIKALLYVHPNSCDLFAEELMHINPQSLYFRVVSNALSAMHTPECQSALLKIMQSRPNDWSLMYELLPQITTMPSPEKNIEDFVRYLAFHSPIPEILGTAQLTLGGIAGNTSVSQPARADSITSFIISHLKNTCDNQQYLLVLGNTRRACIFSEIEPYLKNDSLELKYIAMSALQYLDLPEADSTLMNLARFDKNKKTRFLAKEIIASKKT